MFGGYGLSLDGTTFAIITRRERLFFKVDGETRAAFDKAGGKPFTYQRPTKDGGTRTVSMSYCEAPGGTLASTKRLMPWAERGVAAAKRATAKRTKKKPRTSIWKQERDLA